MDVPRATHRITKDELHDHLADVVKAANETGGPIVKAVPGKGYGLFADREYAPDEKVTRYGGRWGGENLEGPYVIAFAKGRRLDGAYGFLPGEKGRWINDPQSSSSQTESELQKADNVNALLEGNAVWMVATRWIKPGEEILWYYGEDYERPWLNESDGDASMDMSSSPSSNDLLQEYPPYRRKTMLETLQEEGADTEYITRLEQWLGGHGYNLATFDMQAAQRDPDMIERIPRDLRYYLMRIIIDAVLADNQDDPCVGVAQILKLGTRIRSMRELLENDDRVWRRFFEHDFEPFKEKAHWWTRDRPMPWRSAYLWTVFFRRRCLRELAALRGNSLGQNREQTFRPIAFGQSGCVSVLAVYERGWHQPETNRQFSGYATARDLAAGGQYVWASASLQPGPKVNGPLQFGYVGSNPARELMEAVASRWPDDRTLKEKHARWSLELSPIDSGSLSEALLWNYGGSLFGYCWLGSYPLALHQEEFFRQVFEDLPEFPELSGLLYLGTRVMSVE
jgi:hypothetical protein